MSEKIHLQSLITVLESDLKKYGAFFPAHVFEKMNQQLIRSITRLAEIQKEAE